ncbi:MAG TPA: biotin-dependent carboxyltransferase family protein [Gemmataceae bacterium]|nr:biotin-dependent carboxyltransferase family protein [Gemmataceae bacterium]
MTLKVLAPGLHTLLVDCGRPGSRSLGVPVGGAADRFSLAIGNALVGNAPDAVALEINLSGPTLEATCSLACVLWGANFELCRNERALRTGYTFNLEPGDLVRIGGCNQGARAYFCVRGGFDTPPILASRSALTPLQAADSLACQPGSTKGRTVRGPWIWNREPSVLRVLDGSQAAWFSKNEFFEQSFTVSPASNRMGLRLIGRPLTQTPIEIVSEPVCPGTVQVTRDGQCIVLGVDGQTIGGYPKMAQVISADTDKLAQLRAGDKICFRAVSLEVAERIYRQKRAEINEWVLRLNEAREF